MKRAVFAFVFFALAASVSAQAVPTGFDLSNYWVKIEPDKRLIIVLAALDAARTTN
jgi:hypothetical protein